VLPDNQAVLFGLEAVEGYQSIQLDRFWRFVRVLTGSRMRYQYAKLDGASPAVLDMLQVNWLIDEAETPPEPGAVVAARDGPWALYRRSQQTPRASLLFDWTVVATPEAALARVSAPDFDPRTEAVLESDPGIAPSETGSPVGTASYVQVGTDGARVTVEAPTPAVLLVRNAWDGVWQATVDGKPAEVFPVDYLLQGVVVPAGRRTVELRAEDPWILVGVVGSALSGAAGALAFWALRRRERRTVSARHVEVSSGRPVSAVSDRQGLQ
jgi:hypothetical protein